MQIFLQPILFQACNSTLKKVLSEEFNASVSIGSPITEIPQQLFNKQRKQWKSNEVLHWLLDKYTSNRATTTTATKILAMCNFDAYPNGLNFVFGEAYIDGSISAIYLPRLRQEFYGLKPDESLFYRRTVKEAIHELGHAFGLNHCGNTVCVMHLSNSLHDTDIKQNRFCDRCRTRI